MNPPPSTDAFITWAERYRNALDPRNWLILQRQRFNNETWYSLTRQLITYLKATNTAPHLLHFP